MKSNDLQQYFMMLSCHEVAPIDSRLIKTEISRFTILVMVKIVEAVERITLEKQLDEDVEPIVEMNKFNVDPRELDEFFKIIQDYRNIQTATRIHFRPASPGYCWQYHIHYLNHLGIWQHILNKHLIDQSSDQTWPKFCPIL